ncbi:MAG: hypothetical protein GX640_02765 [Fibrobacter sp.]|nr:hypothetical protein [Fibrobacter sp.]
MKYGKIILKLTLIFTSIYLLAGCAKAPDTELSTAQAAIKAALDVESDKYMARNFLNLETAFKAAQDEITLQKNTFFLRRKYTRAQQLLQNVTDLATEIKNETPKAKQEMTELVENNLPIVKDMVKSTGQSIKAASRRKNKNLIAALNVDLTIADSVVDSALVNFKAGKIYNASENLLKAQDILMQINDKLNNDSEEITFTAVEVR